MLKKEEKLKFEQHGSDTAALLNDRQTSRWPVQFTSIQPIFNVSWHAVKTHGSSSISRLNRDGPRRNSEF